MNTRPRRTLMSRAVLLLLVAALLAGCAGSPGPAGEATADQAPPSDRGDRPDRDPRYEGSRPLRPFPPGLEWRNSGRPLQVQDLRGRITILDFWTYGCVNCLHMIPVLQELDKRYGDALALVGVHSAKFRNEGARENLEKTLARYEITHPVVNDAELRVWRHYGARAWPTFLFIDPRGGVIGRQVGEIPAETLEDYLESVIRYWDTRYPGSIARTPPAWRDVGGAAAGAPRTGAPGAAAGTPREGERGPGSARQPERLFRFPEGVAVADDGTRLFISDSGNNRIVELDLDSRRVTRIIGSGEAGLEDGPFATARFHRPRGLAYREETLFVADSGNFALRAVNLAAGSVTTLAGTGEQGRGAPPPGTRFPAPRDYEMSSPWDVAIAGDGRLFLAVTGLHQVWDYDPGTGSFGPLIGTGHEAAISGVPLAEAALAQPSALAIAGDRLFIADAESSTVRSADLSRDHLAVIAGTTANDLFDFGDADGGPGESRLQHPLGIARGGDLVYISDSYNHRIRTVDPTTREVRSLAGSAPAPAWGFRDGDVESARFHEPRGIAFHNQTLYVADTNNHALRVIDLEAQEVSTLELRNPEELRQDPEGVLLLGGNEARSPRIPVETQRLRPGEVTLQLSYTLPAGYALNPNVASTYRLGEAGSTAELRGELTGLQQEIRFSAGAGEKEFQLGVTLYYCEKEDPSVCFVDDVLFELPAVVTDGAATRRMRATRELPLPTALP